MKPCLIVLLLICLAPTTAMAQPAVLNQVGIDQHLGASIPMDLVFHDESGQDVRLSQLFHGRPVLLMLVYYRCPMLCTMSLNQLARSMNVLSESAGEKFDVITVSIDPKETPQLAAEKKNTYLTMYRRPTASAGWHFLTGSQDSISALASAVGFHYAWDPEVQQFAHATALMVLTPKGTISRYFLGIEFPPDELRLAMNQASIGSLGPQAEQVFLYCFHYDPTTGKYGLIINRAIRAGGVLTLIALGSLIFFNIRRERRLARG
jgi:protein SCO1/2